MTTYFRIRTRKRSFYYIEVPKVGVPAYAKPGGLHLTALQAFIMIGFMLTMNCVELIIARDNMVVLQYNALAAGAMYLFNKFFR